LNSFLKSSKFKKLILSALILILCSGCTEGKAPTEVETPTSIKLNKVTDLEVTPCREDYCTLRWTVPISNPEAEKIQRYDVRYDDQPITIDDHFNEAIEVGTNYMPPLQDGESEELTIVGLEKDTKYYFAIKVANQTDQISDYSNVAEGTIDSIKLNQINDLEVTSCKEDFCNILWTVPISDPEAQEIQSYDVRYADKPITNDAQFNEAIIVNTGIFYPRQEGESEQITVSELKGYTTYYFAIKSSNQTDLTSDYSNVASGITKPVGIVFEDNFDEHSDWLPSQLDSENGIFRGESSIPNNYHSYRMQGTVFPSSVGRDSLSITSINSRGSSGKALTIWNETAIDSSSWASDSLLGLELEDEYESIFIRFFIKFDPLWQWGIGNGSPMQKFFRISHWKGTNPFVMFADGAHQPMLIHDLAKFNGGLSDVSIISNFRYTNAYYPQDATPKQSKNKITYYKGGNYGGNGTDFYDPGMLGDGEWHEWKFYVKINSSEGVPDGIYKFWQDNELLVEKTDLAWQDKGATQRDMWNYIMLGGNNFNRFADSSKEMEQWYAIDDLVISTNDIPSKYIPLNKEN
tara:strand:- start:2686 stop:4413 length:1728 start_codon:yes stop_codon:yes gene_type:complete